MIFLSEMGDGKPLGAADGEFLLAPGLMPAKGTVQPVVGVVHAPDELGYLRADAGAALKIHRADLHVAGTFRHTEEIGCRSGDDDPVVLGDDVVDDGQVGAVVEGQSLLAVVDVEIIRHQMLTADDAVAEALYRRIADDVVVVLVAGEDQTGGVAGVGHQLLAQNCIAHLLAQAELAAAPPESLFLAGLDETGSLYWQEKENKA